MRKPRLYFTAILLAVPAFCLAQYSDFDLSRYKLPDIRLNRLDATFNMGSNQSKYDYSGSYTGSSKNSGFNGSLNLNYYYFRNTEKFQGTVNGTLNLQTNPYDNNSGSQESQSKNYSWNFNISGAFRFFSPGQYFLEVSPNVTTQANSYSNNSGPATNVDTYRQTEHSSSYNVSAPVSAGHGRIEPVEDLRLAIYILEELHKAGRIDKTPSDETVIDMAREISRIKRTRFFDTRLMKIKELQVIDSFIVANKIVNKNDINYFAILNDQWDYASGPSRWAGFSYNAGIDNQASLSHNYNSNVDDQNGSTYSISNVNNYFLGGFVQLSYYKPVNLYWQTSVTFRSSYGVQFTDYPTENTSGRFNNYTSGMFRSALGYSIQYLPNSRTSVSLNLQGNYSDSKGNIVETDPLSQAYTQKSSQVYLSAALNMYYYVSPRLRIQLISSLTDINSPVKYIYTGSTSSQNTKTFYFSNALTLTYSFF